MQSLGSLQEPDIRRRAARDRFPGRGDRQVQDYIEVLAQVKS